MMNPFDTIESAAMWGVLLLSLFYYLYKWSTQNFEYFVAQGVPGPKPIPFFGNVWGLWKRKTTDYDLSLFRRYGKMVGVFDGTTPNLLIADADLIRSVMVKDFDHFVNRRSFGVSSKYARKMITIMADEEWKDVRACLTPTFTTGKIKKMAPLIVDCSDAMARKLIVESESNGCIDSNKIFSNFAMDVIAKCAFGMKIDRLEHDEDDFMKNAKKVFHTDSMKSPLIAAAFVDIGPLKAKMTNHIFTRGFQYFYEFLLNVIEDRKNNQEKFEDFIDNTSEAVLEVSKEVNGVKVAAFSKEQATEIIVAQSVIFLLAGFDTTSSVLTHSSFVLAKNPDIQEKLYGQVMDKLEQHGEVCHEMVLDFPYLDQFIREVLRMYPPVLRIERECNKTVTYDGLTIKKGTLVSVATLPLHYSEEYYDEPEKFNPDRWAPENKDNMNPYAYSPFGLGPRNCIGMRFAMEELKIALCTVLSRVKFVPVKETPEKLEFGIGFANVSQAVSVVVGAESR